MFCNNFFKKMPNPFSQVSVKGAAPSSSFPPAEDPPPFWSGAMTSGRIGLFSPSHVVAYVGTLPSQGNHSRWQNEEMYLMQSSAAAAANNNP